MLDFPEEDENSLDPRFVESGYESHFTINMLGVGTVVIAFAVFIMFILLLLIPCKKYCESVNRMHAKTSSIIFWGFWLRFLVEDSLVAVISVICDFFGTNEASKEDVDQVLILEEE